ncbi:hypothetical protein WDV93_08280 [Pantoea ananatis]
MFLGKEIRLKRLLNKKSGRLLAITMDHPITRGVLPGIGPINEVMGKVVAGKPDAITMHKGIIEKSFAPYADTDVSIIMKATSYAIPITRRLIRQSQMLTKQFAWEQMPSRWVAFWVGRSRQSN